ncbi:hypothetical protein LPJ66_010149, partial [Kickxella alabastrina]
MSSWLQGRLFSRTRHRSSSSSSSDTGISPETPQQQAALASAASSPLPPSTGTFDKPHFTTEGEAPAEDAVGPAEFSDAADADAVFAKFSVSEVRQHLARIQRQSSQLQERMRTVAATHYPELIQAADVVVRMDAQSAGLSMRLAQLRGQLGMAQAHAGPEPKPPARAEGSPAAEPAAFAVAAQVKVLGDTGDLVRQALEAQRFVPAALVCLAARQIYADLSAQAAVVRAFPVVERMWAAAAPLAAQVAERARCAIAHAAADHGSDACLGAVCALALLDETACAERVCAEFLALRAAPLVRRLAAAGEDTRGCAVAVAEVLALVRGVVVDYARAFGVPAPAGGGGSGGGPQLSFVVATLGGLCADAELPLPQWGAAAANTAPASARRPEARRRTSSVAGAALVSPLPLPPPPPPRPAQATGSAGRGSNVIVARHLPPSIARFCPPVPRLLDAGARPAHAAGLLSEAPEDAQAAEARPADTPALIRRLRQNAAQLAPALAAQVQPAVDRAAHRALGVWWQATARRVHLALDIAASRVASVAAAADVARALAAECPAFCAAAPLLRDVPVDALYAQLAEPALRRRVQRLVAAAADDAVAQVDAFLGHGPGAAAAAVHAGHLPWRPVPALAGALQLQADLARSLCFLPDAAQGLAGSVCARVEGAWADAQRWWAQMRGAPAAEEADAAAAHFVRQWMLLCERIAADGARSGGAVDRGLRACWAALALHVIARRLLPQLMGAPRGCDGLMRRAFAQRSVGVEQLCAPLARCCEALRAPWVDAVVRDAAAVWMRHFEHLYFLMLKSGAPGRATRRDVLSAWAAAQAQAPKDPKPLRAPRGPKAPKAPSPRTEARYAALRRLALVDTKSQAGARGTPVPSAVVRALAVALRMRVQAVGGLSDLSNGDALWEYVGTRLCRELGSLLAAKEAVDCEWDLIQLRGDLTHVLTDHLALAPDVAESMVSECTKS